MKKLIYAKTLRGNGHYADGKECQDSNSFVMEDNMPTDNIYVLAVADGHGGNLYYRSKRGSQFAVDTIKEMMRAMFKANTGIFARIDKIDVALELIALNKNKIVNPICANKLAKLLVAALQESDRANLVGTKYDKKFFASILDMLNAERKRLLAHLNKLVLDTEKDFLKKWKARVDEDILAHPIKVGDITIKDVVSNDRNNAIDIVNRSYIELEAGKVSCINSGITQNDYDKIGKNMYAAYGSTLLAVGVYGRHVIAMHLGDGNISVITMDDKIIEPLGDDGMSGSNQTYSVCQSNAIEKFRHCYFNKKYKAIVMNTDGLSTGYDNIEDFHEEIVKGLYEYLVSETDTYKESLGVMLRNVSTNSWTRDDVTVGIIVPNVENDIYESMMAQKETKEDVNALLLDYIPCIANYKTDMQYDVQSFYEQMHEAVKKNIEMMIDEKQVANLIEDIDKNALLHGKINCKIMRRVNNTIEKMKKSADIAIQHFLRVHPTKLIQLDSATYVDYHDGRGTYKAEDKIYGIVKTIQDMTIEYYPICLSEYETMLSSPLEKMFDDGISITKGEYTVIISNDEITYTNNNTNTKD